MNSVSQGQLQTNPPVELIREIGEKRASGALRLSRARAKAAIYFETGAIVFAASNLRPHRLLEFLRHLPATFIRGRFGDMSETFGPATTNGGPVNLLPSEAFVLSRVTDTTTLKDLLALCGLSEPEALRTIYGLSITGYLCRNAWPVANITTSRTDKQDLTSAAQPKEGTAEDDIEQLFARLAAAADHYEVLGIGR